MTCLQFESNPVEPKIEKTMVNLELEELKNLAAGDKDFYLDMLNTFVKGTEEGIEKMEECILKSDWENMAEYAHKISSPCRHIGANQLHLI